MKTAFILYTSKDAERNAFLIERYFEAFSRRGIEASLLLTDSFAKSELVSACLGAGLVINRTRDHALAEALEREGVFVSNPTLLCRTANNKLLTYHTLRGCAPMMMTLPLPAGGEAPFEYPFVLKPKAGHGGAGVELIKNADELASYVKKYGTAGVIAQPFADAGRDLRVYVIGGRPAAAMLRSSENDFRSNFCLGGNAQIVPIDSLSRAELDIISAVCEKLPCDYCGVDIIYNNGAPTLNELEDPVGARMLYIYTDIDPAALHVEYVLNKLNFY